MVLDRAFIFQISIPLGKTFSGVRRARSSVKVNVNYQGDACFLMAITCGLVIHKHSLLPFLGLSNNHFIMPYFLTLYEQIMYVCILVFKITTCHMFTIFQIQAGNIKNVFCRDILFPKLIF